MENLILDLIRKIFGNNSNSGSMNTSPLLKMIYPVKTLHILPGRVRFYIPAIKNNRESSKILKEQLIKISAVKKVDVNTVTGSATVVYQAEKIEPEILFAATIKILGLEKELEKKPDPKFSKELRYLYRSLNKAIYHQTNGLLDLQNVIFILSGIGAGKLLLSGKAGLPSAMTHLWWTIYPSLRDYE